LRTTRSSRFHGGLRTSNLVTFCNTSDECYAVESLNEASDCSDYITMQEKAVGTMLVTFCNTSDECYAVESSDEASDCSDYITMQEKAVGTMLVPIARIFKCFAWCGSASTHKTV
jgi:hypothetical protein